MDEPAKTFASITLTVAVLFGAVTLGVIANDWALRQLNEA